MDNDGSVEGLSAPICPSEETEKEKEKEEGEGKGVQEIAIFCFLYLMLSYAFIDFGGQTLHTAAIGIMN